MSASLKWWADARRNDAQNAAREADRRAAKADAELYERLAKQAAKKR